MQFIVGEDHMEADRKLVESFSGKEGAHAPCDWMLKPAEDWDLPMKLLKHVCKSGLNID